MDIRNLEQIQERELGSGTRHFVPWLLASAGAGAIALTVALSLPPKQESTHSSTDPLGDLIAESKNRPPQPVDVLSPDNATFAQMLSDQERPTTALVAVKSDKGRLIAQSPATTTTSTPWPTQKLPVVPLPAGKVLDATAVASKPADPLLTMAADRATISNTAARAPAGTSGKYQIQVASFRVQADAETFARRLQLRGYKAHTQSARVIDRGTWYRVRIGPFQNKYDAQRLRKQFEEKEGMTTFLVDPAKLERSRSRRAAKVAARAKRKSR